MPIHTLFSNNDGDAQRDAERFPNNTPHTPEELDRLKRLLRASLTTRTQSLITLLNMVAYQVRSVFRSLHIILSQK